MDSQLKKKRETVNQKRQSEKGKIKFYENKSLWKENGAFLSSLTYKQNNHWKTGTFSEEYRQDVSFTSNEHFTFHMLLQCNNRT